ncbi:MAG: fumarylacetoacetate hydrolase family protein [Burkholderiaceae bacterium]
MSTPIESIEKAARAIRKARSERKSIERISETYSISGLEAAYAIADANTRLHEADGHRIVGKKVGLTSVAVQKQLGVDQPDFGILFDDMEFLSGSEVPMSRLIQPKVEAEVAFVIGADLGAEPPSWGEFVRAIDYALPAIEIVDSVIDDWKITLVDTVADNASSALYVLGDQPVGIGRVDLAAVPMSMRIDDRVRSEGKGAACLGHPLRAGWWLARTMAARGRPMRAGEVIMSGALGPMVAVEQGAQVIADLGPLGRVDCKMI